MKYLSDMGFSNYPLGIYIRLNQADVLQPRYLARREGPYRINAEITLPASQRELWKAQIAFILTLIEDGQFLPIHFIFNNIMEHLNLEEIQVLEKAFTGVPFRCHAAPESFDPERRNARKERYAKHYAITSPQG